MVNQVVENIKSASPTTFFLLASVFAVVMLFILIIARYVINWYFKIDATINELTHLKANFAQLN